MMLRYEKADRKTTFWLHATVKIQNSTMLYTQYLIFSRKKFRPLGSRLSFLGKDFQQLLRYFSNLTIIWYS